MKKPILLSIALTILCFSCKAEVLWCTKMEMQVYLANKTTIDSLLFLRYPEELAKVYNSYVVPYEGRKGLDFYIKNREFKNICQDFLYKDSLEKRVRNKMIIDQVYQDSINTILIPEYKNHLSGENLSYALHCRKMLELDSAQYSYIMTNAVNMARRIRKDYRINFWNEEMEILKKTLAKRQLRSFFVAKNAVKVTDELNKAWSKLKDAGVTEHLDSAKDASDAINYLFSRQMIKDLYRYYGTSQKKHLAELDKSKPKIIRMLEAIEKKKRAEERSKNINNVYVW